MNYYAVSALYPSLRFLVNTYNINVNSTKSYRAARKRLYVLAMTDYVHKLRFAEPALIIYYIRCRDGRYFVTQGLWMFLSILTGKSC